MSLTVAIIGAGFGGLCMAIQLEKAGIRSYTIFEKASRRRGHLARQHLSGGGV